MTAALPLVTGDEPRASRTPGEHHDDLRHQPRPRRHRNAMTLPPSDGPSWLSEYFCGQDGSINAARYAAKPGQLVHMAGTLTWLDPFQPMSKDDRATVMAAVMDSQLVKTDEPKGELIIGDMHHIRMAGALLASPSWAPLPWALTHELAWWYSWL